MPNYLFSVENKIDLASGNGSKLETIENSQPANAIFSFDVAKFPIYTAGSPFDLGARLSELVNPIWLYIKFYDSSGFRMSLDADTAHLSGNYKAIALKFAPSLVADPPSILLVTTVISRMKILATGNPLD